MWSSPELVVSIAVRTPGYHAVVWSSNAYICDGADVRWVFTERVAIGLGSLMTDCLCCRRPPGVPPAAPRPVRGCAPLGGAGCAPREPPCGHRLGATLSAAATPVPGQRGRRLAAQPEAAGRRLGAERHLDAARRLGRGVPRGGRAAPYPARQGLLAAESARSLPGRLHLYRLVQPIKLKPQGLNFECFNVYHLYIFYHLNFVGVFGLLGKLDLI